MNAFNKHEKILGELFETATTEDKKNKIKITGMKWLKQYYKIDVTDDIKEKASSTFEEEREEIYQYIGYTFKELKRLGGKDEWASYLYHMITLL
jgi:hypothetical protein